MKTFIALLRAVNLGPHQKVAMADLRAMLEAMGARDARTLLQSGNVVFNARARTATELERRLEKESVARLGVATDYMVRTPDEWRGAIDANPFGAMAREQPGRLLLMCLKDEPVRNGVAALRAAHRGAETFEVRGRHLYVCYPDGIGTSRLTNVLIERHLGTRTTGRNWNTVLKLAVLADEVAQGAGA